MRIKLTNGLIDTLRNAFSIAGREINSDPIVVLKINDEGKFLYASNSALGILCKFEISNFITENEYKEIGLPKRLLDFLGYVNDFTDETYLVLDDMINVYNNGICQLKMNCVSKDFSEFNIDTQYNFITNLTCPIGNIINMASYYSSKGEMDSSMILSGIGLEIKKDSDNTFFEVSATDGKKLFLYKTKTESDVETQKVVSKNAFSKVVKFLDVPYKLYSTADYIYFVNNKTTIRLNCMAGKYPFYLNEKIIGNLGERTAKFDPAVVKNAVQQASVVNDGMKEIGVKLSFNTNSCIISSNETQIGKTTINVDCRYNQTPVAMRFDSNHLAIILSTFNFSQSVKCYIAENNPFVITDKEITAVLMPLSEKE